MYHEADLIRPNPFVFVRNVSFSEKDAPVLLRNIFKIDVPEINNLEVWTGLYRYITYMTCIFSVREGVQEVLSNLQPHIFY